jgi:CDP-2,3-bis-(O-geranylgeranyl)-sn-glycerol synthase
MLKLIIIAFYFVLPAYFANMAPVFLAKLGWFGFLNHSIDGGLKLAGQELFGRHKTWRGLLAGIIFGVAVAGLQRLLLNYPFFTSLSLWDYSRWLEFGLLAGLGALVGDLIKSFFKRRVGIKSGGVWPVFDQLDFVAGFFLFTSLIYFPGWNIIIIASIMTLLLHPLTNIIGYLLGLKKVWW